MKNFVCNNKTLSLVMIRIWHHDTIDDIILKSKNNPERAKELALEQASSMNNLNDVLCLYTVSNYNHTIDYITDIFMYRVYELGGYISTETHREYQIKKLLT